VDSTAPQFSREASANSATTCGPSMSEMEVVGPMESPLCAAPLWTQEPKTASLVQDQSIDDLPNTPREAEVVPWSLEDWAAEELEVDACLIEELKKRISTSLLGSVRELSEVEARRLLVANAGNVQRAAAQFRHAEEARSKVCDFLTSHPDSLEEARQVGVVFRLPYDGADLQGHPIVVFNGCALDKSRLFQPIMIAGLVVSEVMDALQRIPAGRHVAKVLLVLYLPGGTHLDVRMVATTISLLSTGLPEHLWRALICPVGAKTPWLYGLIKPFLHENTRRKLVFIAAGLWRQAEARKEMLSFVSPGVLPGTLGGDLDWWPSGAPGRNPWPGT